MALIPCIKCGHEISEIADACPRCQTKTGDLDASFLSAANETVSAEIKQELLPPPPPKRKNIPYRVYNYEPNIIEQFASELYSEAEYLVIKTAALQACIFGAVGFILSVLPFFKDGEKYLVIFGLGLLGGFWGYMIAQPKALALRFQAQMARCVLQIEYNTRDHAS